MNRNLNVVKEMAARDISIDDVARALGIHRNSAANKVHGKTSFSIEEGFRLHDIFFPDLPMKELFQRAMK